MENFNSREKSLENLEKATQRGNIGIYKYVKQRFDRFNGEDYKRLDKNIPSEMHTLLTNAFKAMDLKENVAVVARFVTDFVIPYFKANDLNMAILESNYIVPMEQEIIAHSYMMNALEGEKQTPETSIIDNKFNAIMKKSDIELIELIDLIPNKLHKRYTIRSNLIIDALKEKQNARNESLSIFSPESAKQLINLVIAEFTTTDLDPENKILLGYTAAKATNLGLGKYFVDLMTQMNPTLAQVFGDEMILKTDDEKLVNTIINNLPDCNKVNTKATTAYLEAKQQKKEEEIAKMAEEKAKNIKFGSMQDIFETVTSKTTFGSMQNVFIVANSQKEESNPMESLYGIGATK